MDLTLTPKSLLLLLAAWTLSLSAAAQWQWIDKDGRKVFSDRPPAADIKEKDILKQPGGKGRAAVVVVPAEANEAGAATSAAASAATAATAAAKANAPKLSGKDAELQAKKKKLEQEEADQKKAEAERVSSIKAENCERAKKGLASFQSGVRVSTVNAKGEREIMDDNTRAAESKRLQAIIDSECK
ncbi:MAG: DUF4124 domain-containing protein [Polaromonas sp.]|nr:DUF4124 domain-containing protein [Polaromonas sp.]MDP3752956.1 DUF4124 domain-containing protein [Polaromonas sp.]